MSNTPIPIGTFHELKGLRGATIALAAFKPCPQGGSVIVELRIDLADGTYLRIVPEVLAQQPSLRIEVVI
jgi:hypothetical protein